MGMQSTVFVGLMVFSIGAAGFSQAPARSALQQQQTPYTAEFKVTTVRTAPDSAPITEERTEVLAADTEGRRLVSTKIDDPKSGERTVTIVFDLATGTRTSWDNQRKQAFESSLRSTGNTSCGAAAAQTVAELKPASKQTVTTKDLGVETIGGVEAHGLKTTFTIPAGEAGNSEPLVSTHEVWESVSIRPSLTVRQIDDDPRSGKTTREMTDFSRREPEAASFQPPRGYEIVKKDASAAPCPATHAPAASEAQ